MNERLARLFPEWTSWSEFWTSLEFGRELQQPTTLGFVIGFVVIMAVFILAVELAVTRLPSPARDV